MTGLTNQNGGSSATFHFCSSMPLPHSASLFAKSSLTQIVHPRVVLIGLICSTTTSYSAMDKHLQQDKQENADLLRERCTKEACEVGGTRRLSDEILPHILNLYGSCATARDFEIYAPHATFEDPLMRAHGVQQIKSAFYSIPKIFSESRIVEYSITENVISPDTHEILIDNKQFYKFLGKGIDMISLIRLYVEDGKVVRHEDWWNKNPLWNRETVKLPLFGRIIEAARRGSMFTTHLMMGFGKDPDS
uniref:SnoaL-like domain-containing protein n=1 Tax=Kalanchoe fedtschenkoi TaxID=63787 RepID=A0A7N0TR63_KALFE